MAPRTKRSSIGAPPLARSGAGQAGLDSPTVRPLAPGKVGPGLYSTNILFGLSPFFFGRHALILSSTRMKSARPKDMPRPNHRKIKMPNYQRGTLHTRINVRHRDRLSPGSYE